MTEKTIQALQKQIGLEAYASQLYLAMASWCDSEGLAGAAAFFYRQSDEERQHMLRIVHFLNDSDQHAEIPGVDPPPNHFESLHAVFQQVLQHEQKVTKAIHQIVQLCMQENDFTTWQFLQWFVDEQHEEEALVRSILDKFKLIGDSPQGLYLIDREIDTINQKLLNAPQQ